MYWTTSLIWQCTYWHSYQHGDRRVMFSSTRLVKTNFFCATYTCMAKTVSLSLTFLWTTRPRPMPVAFTDSIERSVSKRSNVLAGLNLKCMACKSLLIALPTIAKPEAWLWILMQWYYSYNSEMVLATHLRAIYATSCNTVKLMLCYQIKIPRGIKLSRE